MNYVTQAICQIDLDGPVDNAIKQLSDLKAKHAKDGWSLELELGTDRYEDYPVIRLIEKRNKTPEELAEGKAFEEAHERAMLEHLKAKYETPNKDAN